MRARWLSITAACGVTLATALALGWATEALAQDDDARAAQARDFAELAMRVPNLERRLEALAPTAPLAYLELGEDVADAALTPRDRTLATELFVLAFVLAQESREARGISASACLALADLPGRERFRPWLTALARSLDARQAGPEWLAPASVPATDSAAFQVATLLGLVRSGDGALARQLLDKPDVKAAVEGMDSLLLRMGVQGGAKGLEREAQRWPCRECQNQRFIRRTAPGGGDVRICPSCKGVPGPEVSPEMLFRQLRLEATLLQGVQRSWAAQVLSDDGAPLLDPDPAELPRVMDVDPSRRVWRAGRWVRPEGAEGAEVPRAPTLPAREAPPERAPVPPSGG
jgi:hypothetical protein